MTVSDEMAGALLAFRGDTRSLDSASAPQPSSREPNLPIEWVNRELGGRYVARHVLGEGAMGTVFMAEHVGLGMAVALKVIHPRLAAHAGSVARFRREAHLVSRINHPNVVSVMDYGTLDGRIPFLVMQLVKGIDLRQVMESEEPVPWPAAVAIVSQLCDALGAAQVHGIIHRDIKPANIVLEPVGRGREPLVKLLDFGIAKLDANMGSSPSVGSAQLTPFGVIVGTPGYMAPEQYVGERVTHRSDLYALGVVLWELIRGQRLFPGGCLPELLRLQMRAPERCAELRGHDVPPALEELVAELLSYSAFGRPDSARSVGQRLRALTPSTNPVAWGTLPSGEAPDTKPVAPNATPEVACATRIESAAGRGKARPRVAWGLGFVVLLLFVAVSVTWLSGSAKQQKAVPPTPVAGREPSRVTAVASRVPYPAVEQEAPDAPAPSYLIEAERMQEKRTCRGKLPHLRRLMALRDPRALPFVERLAERPRSGCGPRRHQDCLACMRSELGLALASLRALEGAP